MGTVGFHRVRPVHIQTLTDQYRRMLGEIRFHQKQACASSSKLQELTHACHLLEKSLAMIDHGFNAATIRPISYRPPVELPGPALIRAVLAELRLVAARIDEASLTTAIAQRHGIAQSAALTRRVVQCITALAKQGVVQSDRRGCILTHLATSETPHH